MTEAISQYHITNKTFTRYYYIRDGRNRPVITVCLLKIGKQLSRGVALCSDKDNPCKKTGRNIARGRAEQAMFNEMNCNALNRLDLFSVQEIIKKEGMNPFHKAIFNPVPTNFEHKLLK